LGQKSIPVEWSDLRKEALPFFEELNIWVAKLVPLKKK